jgi:hypothetical protein
MPTLREPTYGGFTIRELRESIHSRGRAVAALPDLLDEIEGTKPCPLCFHEWRRHDPEDGRCDAPANGNVLGPCPCGRDIAWIQARIASLARMELR